MERVIIHKKDRIDYILAGVANYYQITQSELKAKLNRPTRDRLNAKSIALKLLVEIADCSIKEAGVVMGYTHNCQGCVGMLIRNINEDISERTWGNAVKTDYKFILNELGL